MSQGPDVLCTDISSTTTTNSSYVIVEATVSDAARAQHVDDGDVPFSTGRQSVRRVEAFADCHPFLPECRPVATKTLADASPTTTVVLRFTPPVGRRDGVVYVRATDSEGYTGPVTARRYVVRFVVKSRAKQAKRLRAEPL